jgi:hypothetical protein
LQSKLIGYQIASPAQLGIRMNRPEIAGGRLV